MFRMNSDEAPGMDPRNDGSVDVLLKRGNRFTAPFGDFIEAKNIIGLKNDINYLCTDEEADVIEYVIQKDHYLVGTC